MATLSQKGVSLDELFKRYDAGGSGRLRRQAVYYMVTDTVEGTSDTDRAEMKVRFRCVCYVCIVSQLYTV